MTIIQVLKRDGAQQDWNKSKLLNSVTQAGVTPQEAESVSSLIEIWAERSTAGQPLKSADIRAKVLDILRVVDPKAAGAFETYKKPAA